MTSYIFLHIIYRNPELREGSIPTIRAGLLKNKSVAGPSSVVDAAVLMPADPVSVDESLPLVSSSASTQYQQEDTRVRLKFIL